MEIPKLKSPNGDPKDELRTITQTKSLKISREAIDEMSQPQAEALLQHVKDAMDVKNTLQAQNLVLAQIVTTLNIHTDQLDAGDKVMKTLDERTVGIDSTTKDTNGKVKKLRSEYDASKGDIAVLMKERTEGIVEEETARIRREGMMVIPKKISAFLKFLWKNILRILQWLGAVAVAWPALVWLWGHRPHIWP